MQEIPSKIIVILDRWIYLSKNSIGAVREEEEQEMNHAHWNIDQVQRSQRKVKAAM